MITARSNGGLRITKPFKVLVSLVTSTAFLFNTVYFDVAWAVGNTAGLPGGGSYRAGSSGLFKELRPDTFSLPEYLGHIKDSWSAVSTPRRGLPSRNSLARGESPQKVVIHIQDAHCNYAAQQKISEIIEYLNKEYGIDTVNLEGGAKDYDLSPFTRISDKAIREKTADYFVKEGLVNGAEYFAANNPEKVTLWGIEDTKLYIDNLKVYRDSLKYKDEVDKHLKALTHILNNLKAKIYSQDLLELDSRYSQYKAGAVEFKDYLAYLIRAAKEKSIDVKSFTNIYLLSQTLEEEGRTDFKKANNQREDLIDKLQKKLSRRSLEELVVKTVEFKSEKISQKEFYIYLTGKAKISGIEMGNFSDLQKYIVYISMYDAIDKMKIVEEMEKLENSIKEPLYRNDKERELNKLSKNLAILKNIFNISLTKEDYRYYKDNEESFNVGNYTSFINKEAPLYNITAQADQNITNLDSYRENISKFYEYSFKRDNVFLKNMKFAQKTNNDQRTTILITGGFHTENLCEKFKKEGISYISIMPNFKDCDGYECPYFKVLSDGHEPITKAILEWESVMQVPSYLSAEIAKATHGVTINGITEQDAFKAAIAIIEELKTKDALNVIMPVADTGKTNIMRVFKAGDEIKVLWVEEKLSAGEKTTSINELIGKTLVLAGANPIQSSTARASASKKPNEDMSALGSPSKSVFLESEAAGMTNGKALQAKLVNALGYKFTLMKVFGIPIKIHWSTVIAIPAFIAYSFMVNMNHPLMPTFMIFISLVGHELAHAIFSLRSGVDVEEIVIYPHAGLTRSDFNGSLKLGFEQPAKAAYVSAAGPAFNLLLGGLIWSLGVQPTWPINGNNTLQNPVNLNLVCGAVSLAPLFMQDGSRVYKNIFSSILVLFNFGKAKSHYHAAVGTSIIIFFLSAVGTFLTLSQPALCVFLEAILVSNTVNMHLLVLQKASLTSSAYIHLGYVYLEEGEDEKAIEAFKAAVMFNPCANTYDSLGFSLVKLGRYDEATEAYQKAVQLKPAKNYNVNTLKYCNPDPDKYDEAIKILTKALELVPAAADLYTPEDLKEVNNRREESGSTSGGSASQALRTKLPESRASASGDTIYDSFARRLVPDNDMSIGIVSRNVKSEIDFKRQGSSNMPGPFIIGVTNNSGYMVRYEGDKAYFDEINISPFTAFEQISLKKLTNSDYATMRQIAVHASSSDRTTVSNNPMGGAWFGHSTYMRYFSWWVEPPISYILALPLWALLLFNGNQIWASLAAALIFWSFHSFRGKTALFSREVIGLSIGMAIAGAPLFAIGVHHLLTQILLGVLTASHIIINWRAAPDAMVNRPLSLKQKIGTALFTTLSAVILTCVISFNMLTASGKGFSLKYALSVPRPIAVTVDSNASNRPPPKVIIKLSTEIDAAISNNAADRLFWEGKFKNYPEDIAVTEVVTPDRIKHLYETRQLNHLFNGLRTQPDLLYRYLGEIPQDQHMEFARYFATLKPGTRQKIFELFYRRLRDDMMILENGQGYKAVIFHDDMGKLSEQCDRMERLYVAMAQMLNRIEPLRAGELPDNAIAPPSIPGFTRDRAIKNIENAFKDVIKNFKSRGYSVTLPDPAKINVSSVAGLIGYYESSYGDSHLRDNQAVMLLQWVMEETDPNNHDAHQITEKELLEKAMWLHADKEHMKIDLFKAIGTIGHYYKAMARNPYLILGGPEARANESGIGFILKRHDRMHLIGTLDPNNKLTVDENGQPMILWRPVDKNGNDWIPRGQKEGKIWPSIEDDEYHGINFILTALYVHAKTLPQIKEDFMKYQNMSMSRLYDIHGTERLTGYMLHDTSRLAKNLIVLTRDTPALPAYYKYALETGIGDVALEMFSFGTPSVVKSEERAKYMFGEVGAWIYSDLTKEGLVKIVNAEEILEGTDILLSKRTIIGQNDIEAYKKRIMSEWEHFGKPPLEKLHKKDPRAFWRFVFAFAQIAELTGKYEGISTDDAMQLQNYRIAKNAKLPEILAFFASDKDLSVRAEVASNRNTSLETLELLAADPDSAVRMGVARNSVTPARILSTLAPDSEDLVKEEVAKNENTTEGMLTKLLRDKPLRALVIAVLSNRNISKNVLEEYAHSEDPDFRGAVACNPIASYRLLLNLSSDADEKVRTGIVTNKNAPLKLRLSMLKTIGVERRRFISGGPDHDRELQFILMQDSDLGVRINEFSGAGDPLGGVNVIA